MIKIEFGIPEHGWLPTKLSFEGFEFEEEISDVPVDPMDQLCDALIMINMENHQPIQIVWHLEPYCYYVELKKTDQLYTVFILESVELGSPSSITFQIAGTYREIILPIYIALLEFWSKSYKSPHWDALDSSKMELLIQVVNEHLSQNM